MIEVGGRENPANWQVIAFTEAAQNAATQTGIAAIAEDAIVRKSGDKFIALRDLWIFYAYIFGDSLDITRWALEGSFMGGRTFDARGSGIETGHDVPSGVLDLRYSPIKWPKGDSLEVKFTEDKSTNVEASVLVWITPDPYNLDWSQKTHLYEEVLQLTLTGASTTGGAWFDSTKTLNDNQDTRDLDPNKIYEVIGSCGGLGGSSIKAARLVFPDSIWKPGFKVPEDNIDLPIPEWEQYWPSMRPRFDGDSPPKMETLDTDGSLTPIVTWRVGRL